MQLRRLRAGLADAERVDREQAERVVAGGLQLAVSHAPLRSAHIAVKAAHSVPMADDVFGPMGGGRRICSEIVLWYAELIFPTGCRIAAAV